MYLSMTRTPLLAVLAIPAVSPAQTDKRVRDLDTYTAQAVKDWGAPGLAISVVKDGRDYLLPCGHMCSPSLKSFQGVESL